ncbi:hypothetical protein FNV43_RR03506 [Rhamnella rubrinervis]|uniref:Small ribosomal subunit protein eS4 central region domain-containing protein n=1 Tax=Rhamnella rubrinervis TaxID=2594499 RepID=A0A8K0HK47_9ROSA|nr:hypothetical protein FNV43_RR03506 [Rhamnella rubrinervis]
MMMIWYLQKRVFRDWLREELVFDFATPPESKWECLPAIEVLLHRDLSPKHDNIYFVEFRTMMLVIDYRYRVFPELSQYRWIFSEEYPTGFMEVLSLPASKANVRLMYDAKGRLLFHKISDKEAKIDLRKVMYVHSENETCTLCLHDKRIICNADPNIQVNDTIKFDYAKKKIIDYAKVGVGNFVMVTGGRHKGRVGVIRKMGVKEHNKMKTIGLIRIEDDLGREFATSLDHVL